MPEYLAYLDAYCAANALLPQIRFGRRVASLSRRGGGYDVRTTGRDGGGKRLEHFDAVVVCSGLHLHPLVPRVEGMAAFRGEALHSAEYRNRARLADKRVLVVGCGETAHDVAAQATTVADAVTMSHKSGWLGVPACVHGLPLDIFITNAFESCYEVQCACHARCSAAAHTLQSELVDASRVKWAVATPFIRLALWLATGTSVGYDQWCGAKPDVRRGYHFIMKSPNAQHALNAAVDKGWRAYPWKWLPSAPPPRRPIQLVPQIERFDPAAGGSFVAVDGQRITADTVVFATGYRQTFPFLEPLAWPKTANGDHELPALRQICNPDEPGLAFLGFARPNVGAIPPISEVPARPPAAAAAASPTPRARQMQIMWLIQAWRGRLGPLKRPTYALLSQRSSKVGAYGVRRRRRWGCVPQRHSPHSRPKRSTTGCTCTTSRATLGPCQACGGSRGTRWVRRWRTRLDRRLRRTFGCEGRLRTPGLSG